MAGPSDNPCEWTCSYGRSAFTVRSLVQKTVASFVNLYHPEFVSQGAFTSIANFSAATNLQDAASVSASDYFSTQGVSDLFTNELTSAATQVNYGTPVSRLHGVGALVSLAATGAVAVRGGNRQIFENFVGKSGARLRLGENARVEELLKLDAGVRRRRQHRTSEEEQATERTTRAQWVVKTASGIGGGTYDVNRGFTLCSARRKDCTSDHPDTSFVFPGDHPRCALPPHRHPLCQQPRAGPHSQAALRQALRHFHHHQVSDLPCPCLVISSERRADVQLILSNDAMTHSATTPQASYFGLKEGTPMPNEIFGTFTTPSTRKPTFNSLNYLKPLPSAIGARFGGGGSNETDTTTFHVVKMFSDRSLLVQQDDDGTSTLLDDLFGRYNVVKTVEKTWFAYPRLAPVRNPERDYAPVRPDQGLYYVNAMERLVSTMETEVRFLTFRFVLSFSILLNFRRERKGTGD